MSIEIETAWLAGLMEGEGCFSLNRRPSGRGHIRTMLFSMDEDVVRRAHQIGGVGAVRKDKRDGGWWWTTSGEGAAAVSLRLYPYLGVRRRARIDEIISEWRDQEPPVHHHRAKTHCKNGHPFDEANTHYDSRGYRNCRACWREWYRRKSASDPGWTQQRLRKERERRAELSLRS